MGPWQKEFTVRGTLVPTRSSPSDCVGSAGRAPAVSGGGEYRITAYMPVCDRAHCVGGLGRACDAFSRCKGRGACRDAASLGHLAGQLLPTSQVRLLLLWAGCMQRKWDVLMRRWLRWRADDYSGLACPDKCSGHGRCPFGFIWPPLPLRPPLQPSPYTNT